MNHDFQKYVSDIQGPFSFIVLIDPLTYTYEFVKHEEDAIVMIMDVLEIHGWKFVHQYDQELSSEKMNGSSYTKRELFLFQKEK